MAACLITVSGTSGELLLKYTLGGLPKATRTGIGTLYLEDTATAVTYSTLSGDVIASSLCFTITSLPYTCYRISWKGVFSPNYKFVSVTLGADTHALTEAPFGEPSNAIVSSVNELNIPDIKISEFLSTEVYSTTLKLTYSERSYTVKVLGAIVPIFKIKNADNSAFIHLHGVASTCSNVGYTQVNICSNNISL